MIFTKIQTFKKRKRKAFTVVEMILIVTAMAVLVAGAFFAFQDLVKSARISTMNSDLSNIRTAATAYSAMSKAGTVPSGTVTVAAFTLTAADSLDGTGRKFLTGELKDPWGGAYSIDAANRTVKCAGSSADNVSAKTVEF